MQTPGRAYLSLDVANIRQTALAYPDGFIARLPDRVTIDEIQRAPDLLLAIKQNVDDSRQPGRFLLTGSANLLQLPRLADSLAIALQLDRQTIDRYFALLERLFLIRRLPAWHRNPANRLVKSPKLHLVDSGLAAALTGLQPTDWNTRRARFGHLLESFVFQQLVALGGATAPDLHFWHYRDKDQVEWDVVMTCGDAVWASKSKLRPPSSPPMAKACAASPNWPARISNRESSFTTVPTSCPSTATAFSPSRSPNSGNEGQFDTRPGPFA